MPFPEPYAGLVIRYSYLWKREHEAGREDGTKDRPCAVVMAMMDHEGDWEVLVLPITHSPPPDAADAIEIATETKKRLGLDTVRSWIMITEANEFLWPGPDLRPVPGGDASTIAYGPLPPRFFAQVRDKFLERDRSEKSTNLQVKCSCANTRSNPVDLAVVLPADQHRRQNCSNLPSTLKSPISLGVANFRRSQGN